jgi:hypothetical protein
MPKAIARRSEITTAAVALFLAGSACAPAAPEPRPVPPPAATLPEPAPPPVAPTADVPAIAQTAEKFEAVRLELVSDPYTEKPLPSGQRLGLRGDYAGANEQPARWLVHVPRGVSVVDASNMKSLGTIDSADAPDDVFESVAAMPGFQGPKGREKHALLRFEDGKVVIPVGKLPNGAAANIERIIAGHDSDSVIVVGRAADKSLHFGRWDDTKQSAVLLPHPALVSGIATEWNPEAKAWELYASDTFRGHQAGPGCVRARLLKTGASCVLDAGQAGLALGGDWFASDASVFNAKTRERFAPSLGGRAIMVARLDSPPRALYASQQHGSDTRTFELIGVNGSLGTWSASFADRTSFSAPLYPKDQPVVTERALKGPDHVNSEFSIDLHAGKVFLTPGLDMVLVIGKGERRFLAVQRGSAEDRLVVVDLTQRKLTAVANLPPCPGIYWPDGERESWLAASCMIQPRPSHFSFIQQWSVLVDTKTKRYFKTPLTPFALRPGNRVVLGTGRKRGAERVIRSGTVTLVDLSP